MAERYLSERYLSELHVRQGIGQPDTTRLAREHSRAPSARE